VSPVIIVLVALAFGVKSWIDGAKDTVDLAVRVGGVARRGYASLGPLQSVAAMIVTALVLVAQLGMLWLVYVCGNLTSLFVQLIAANGDISSVDSGPAQRIREFGSSWSADGIGAVWSELLDSSLTLDWISAAVLIIALLALWGGYRQARFGRKVGIGWGLLASVPVSGYFFMWAFGLAMVLLNRLLTGDPSQTADDMAFLLPAELACALYCLTCIVATKGSRCVVAAWSSRSVASA
jgi:hypothetical protein